MKPFYITIDLEGKPEELYVVPEPGKNEYGIFDKNTFIGKVWFDVVDDKRSWCGEGAMVTPYVQTIVEQIDFVLDA